MKEQTLVFQAETQLPTEFGSFRFLVYKNASGEEVMAIATRGVEQQKSVAVRVHSACFTAEVIGSLKCDCKQQLDYALDYISQHGGIVIYLPQEGRGIGLSNKIRAYALQENGHDTIQANSLLGLPVDSRRYDDAALILRDMGVNSISLITNNPLKIEAMTDLGLQVVDRIPVPAISNQHSHRYLETKREQMGHLLTTNKRQNTNKHQKTGSLKRPFVHINFAIDQVGRMNQSDGQAVNLSCDKDWQRVHELRERYSAVVVGARTWNLDQPQLTARPDRLGRLPKRQPDRVIFAGRTPCTVLPDSRRSFVVGINSDHGDCININATDRNLKKPLEQLFISGVETLLVEGGITLLRSFISQKMVDRFTIYVSTTSVDKAKKAVRASFPELPIMTMDSVPFGNGTLLSLNARDLQQPTFSNISFIPRQAQVMSS